MLFLTYSNALLLCTGCKTPVLRALFFCTYSKVDLSRAMLFCTCDSKVPVPRAMLFCTCSKVDVSRALLLLYLQQSGFSGDKGIACVRRLLLPVAGYMTNALALVQNGEQ